MYCKSCGKQIDDNSRFCQHCGTNLQVEKKIEYTENSKIFIRHSFKPLTIKRFIYVILGLISCTLCAYFPLEQRIENDAQIVVEEDSINYREEAICQLDKVFEGTEGNFGCVLYYNILPNFEYVPNSKRDVVFPDKELNELRKLSDLNSIYLLSPKVEENLWKVKYNQMLNSVFLANIDRGDEAVQSLNGYKSKQSVSFWQSGWVIGYAARNSEDSYCCFLVYPYMVGYFENTDVNEWELSEEIEKTLDFFVNDRKSFICGYVNDGFIRKFKTLASQDLGAGLFSFEEDSTRRNIGGISECISNSYRRVYIRSSITRNYVLKYCNDYDESTKNSYISEHRYNLIQVLAIIVGVLTLLLLLLLCVYYRKKRTMENVQQDNNANKLLDNMIETDEIKDIPLREELKIDISKDASIKEDIKIDTPVVTDGKQTSRQRTFKNVFVIFAAIVVLVSLSFISASHLGFIILLNILTWVIFIYRILYKKRK